MTTLTGTKPRNTYKDLLQISNGNAGIDATPRAVEDGEGTPSPLQLSSNAVNIESGFKLGGTAVSVAGIALLTATDEAAQRAALELTVPTYFTGDNTGATDVASAVTTLFSADGTYAFPAGTYTCGAVSVTGRNLTIDFAEGAVLEALSGTDVVWTFTNCNIRIKNFKGDGKNLAQNMIKMDGGTLIGADNVQIVNMGRPGTTATNLVTGLWLKNLTSARIGRAVFADFACVGNGTLGDGVGACRGIYIEGCGWVDVDHFEMSGGTANEDSDFFQVQLNNVGGVIKNFVARYNGNTRRCFKQQSGRWTILNADIRPGSDFTADSVSTSAGTYNVNCVDYAGTGTSDTLDVVSGYIDASGYATGVSNNSGASVRVHSGVHLKGGTLDVIRTNPDSGSPQNQTSIGFYASPTAGHSGVRGARIQNFGRGVVLQGNYTYCESAEFIDPTAFMAEVGTSAQKSNIRFTGNRCRTQTSGYLNLTRIVRVFNVLNFDVSNNELIQDGNTGHATRFIDFTDANAVGRCHGNKAPSGVTVQNGTAVGLEFSGTNGAVLVPSVNTAAVGNVGTGEDNLRTYLLLAGRFNTAGKGIRITAWGTGANNAKTLKLYFGSTVILTASLTTSQANRWRVVAEVYSTGTDAQDYVAQFIQGGTVSQADVNVGSSTEDDGATITIKCTGEATTTNDIVQEGLLIESLTGNAL
ncbi:hypothetical protein J8F10_24105 [Gemmata sp. G18]|uniref:Pectate lyase superfamily protein domain-containing protein n=1 Tax=Gemmata palustris TaxID=2822762 RepID=A0ABS5BX76_9BACT|nr:hypothetical protein [Gemmata palustris]MBP3958344.1 hypothetical protein [Gemmata palustris]